MQCLRLSILEKPWHQEVINKILQTTVPSHLSLDAIIGKNKSAAIKKKTILQILSAVGDITDV